MIRLIKRYESRKLYDTEESRYVSLEDIAAWIREGQDVRVVDNATSADVTSQTLTQIIVEEGRKGGEPLPSELLHDLVRLGERTVSSGIEQVQSRVGKLVEASIDRLGPVRRAREEMNLLRDRLEQLEASLEELEVERATRATAARTAGETPAPGGGQGTAGGAQGPAGTRPGAKRGKSPAGGSPRKKTSAAG